MGETTLKTRIQHKRETAANWGQATNFVPKDGELIVYKDGTNPMLKIGDGTTNVNSLPFIKGYIPFGTCNTAANVAAKTVNITGFVLVEGTSVLIKFSHNNTASSPTLNVNNTGAKAIKKVGTTNAGTVVADSWAAGNTVLLTYDGSYWVLTNFATDTRVKSNNTSNNYNYPILLNYGTSATTNNNVYIDTEGFTFNPYSNNLKVVKINGIEVGDTPAFTDSTAYCDTTAETAAKIATCSDYSLLQNSYIPVLIVNSNTSASVITLNINGKGAKTIWINGVVSSDTNYTLPAGNYLVFYDGTNYYFRTDGKIPGYDNSSLVTENFMTSEFEKLIPHKVNLIATEGQTDFTIPFAYDTLSSNLSVYYNGLLMKETDNYTVINTIEPTDTNYGTIHITFTAEAGDIITIMGILGATNIDFDQAAIDAINNINQAVSDAQDDLNDIVQSVSDTIDQKIDSINDFIEELPDDVAELANKNYVNNKIQEATSSIVTDIWQASTTEPTNQKLLWIDTNTNGGLKYYNGSSWVVVPVCWS